MTRADRPIVRLNAKADARAIRHGFPWAYADEIVADRRTRALAPGTIAVLEDVKRKALGTVAVNPASKIFCRLLDRDPAAAIDTAWFAERLTRALTHRERLYDRPYYRLVHAEADGLPGIVIDRFDDHAVLQPNAAWADRLSAELGQAITDVTGCGTVILNGSGRARPLEGLRDETRLLSGTTPKGPVPVEMNDAVYMADLMGGQKTGLFFDQRPNHAFAASLARGGRVLDVFSHVGGFALACLAGGAASATCIDASEPALDLAREGAARMDVAERLSVQKADAFDGLGALAQEGATFDLVICDPPAFAPSKQALDAGLRAYERVARLAAPLVAEGGYLGLCSCSHAADLTKFRNASARGIGRARRRGVLVHTGGAGPDHPLLPQLAETGYLKALFFRL